MQNKPKGLKVTKEDLKADRHDGHKAEREALMDLMMADQHDG